MRAFHQRIAARRGGNIATVAVARKLAVIAWHMLSRGEHYAFARPPLTHEEIRRLELMTGAEHQKGAVERVEPNAPPPPARKRQPCGCRQQS